MAEPRKAIAETNSLQTTAMMKAAPVSEPTPAEWTLVGGDRDLVQRVAALQAANAALEARLAAQEAKLAALHAELSTMRASKASVSAAAGAQSADAFKWAVPQRLWVAVIVDDRSWRSGFSTSRATLVMLVCPRTSGCSLLSTS